MNPFNSIKTRYLETKQCRHFRRNLNITHPRLSQRLPGLSWHYQNSLGLFVLLASIFTLGLFCTGCGNSFHLFWSYSANKELQKNVSAEKIYQLEVETKQGSITVSGHKKDDIQIIARIVARDISQSAAERLTEKVELSIDRTNNLLKISPSLPLLVNPDHFQVSLEIRIPWQYAQEKNKIEKEILTSAELPIMKLRTSTASIKVVDVGTMVDAETSTGHIKVSKIRGSAKLKTSTAGIDLEDVTSNVDAETSTGCINVTKIQGSVNLRTSTAGISVTNVTGDVTAQTSTGSIKVSSCEGHANISSHAGAVDVTVNAWDGTPVSASSRNNTSTLKVQFSRTDSGL